MVSFIQTLGSWYHHSPNVDYILHLQCFTDGMKTRMHQIQLVEQFQLCLSFRTFLKTYQVGHFIFDFAMQMWLSPGTPHTQLSVNARCMIHTPTLCSSPHGPGPWPKAGSAPRITAWQCHCWRSKQHQQSLVTSAVTKCHNYQGGVFTCPTDSKIEPCVPGRANETVKHTKHTMKSSRVSHRNATCG